MQCFLFLARAVNRGLLQCSAHLLPSRWTQQIKQLSYVNNSWITWQHRRMQYSPTAQATWSSQSQRCIILIQTQVLQTRGWTHVQAGKDNIPFNNGAFLNILQIIWAVMSSAAETELGALFINAKTAVLMRQTLMELGHPQPCTPMQTNNATAHALLTNKILPKALKAMDMHLHWLKCHDTQDQSNYYWRPGTPELGRLLHQASPN